MVSNYTDSFLLQGKFWERIYFVYEYDYRRGNKASQIAGNNQVFGEDIANEHVD